MKRPMIEPNVRIEAKRIGNRYGATVEMTGPGSWMTRRTLRALRMAVERVLPTICKDSKMAARSRGRR